MHRDPTKKEPHALPFRRSSRCLKKEFNFFHGKLDTPFSQDGLSWSLESSISLPKWLGSTCSPFLWLWLLFDIAALLIDSFIINNKIFARNEPYVYRKRHRQWIAYKGATIVLVRDTFTSCNCRVQWRHQLRKSN